MATYSYVAIDSQGKRKKGVVEADNLRQARQQLRERSLMALEINSLRDQPNTKKKSWDKSYRMMRMKRMKSADLMLVTRQISTLLTAGIPLDEVLASVAEQNEKANVKSIILGVRAKVMEGYSLAAGMNDFPGAFPRLYRVTIAAGEKSAKLAQVLERLAEYTERQQHIKRKVQQAMIYPALMTAVSIMVVIFMLMYVVPKIIQVFNQTNQVLPFSTVILVAASTALQKYGVYMLAGIVLAAYFIYRCLKREKYLRMLHVVLLKIPLLNKSIRTVNGARFARTFGILNAAGVPVLEAMHTSAQLISPLPMREAVLACIEQVREGAGIHLALKKTGYFSPMFIHLIASGEASGQLNAMLQKAATNQESEVEALIDGSLTLFEPIMILVMGGIVTFIVMAIMLPIFSLDNFNG